MIIILMQFCMLFLTFCSHDHHFDAMLLRALDRILLSAFASITHYPNAISAWTSPKIFVDIPFLYVLPASLHSYLTPTPFHITDCEEWCSNSTIDHCKFCKCRGCSSCYTLPLPSWTRANPVAVQAACSQFGMGICNASGDVNNRLAAAWASWNYNRTSAWIDDIFNATYRLETKGFRAQTVDAEFGLENEELESVMQHSDAHE
mmetsp:Transcript_4043/g.8637  ORF Transcript_4043/g.8637 Transcript_4043/m.8637 type:complete len:204 (-) Transcript_4043:44-655(-)